EQVGGGHGVVDHQGYSDTVCGVGDGAHVQDVAAGVGQALGEVELGLGPGERLPGGGVVLILDEADLDTKLRERVAKQVVGAPVELGAGDHVVTGLDEVEDTGGDGGRSGRERNGPHTTLQGCDALFQHVLGRVHDPRVDVARLGEAEQIRTVLGVPEDVRGRLIDRRGPRVGGRVGTGACVNLL